MTTSNFDSEEFYVCAGICRIDYETNTCIGCGRPSIDAPVSNPRAYTDTLPTNALEPSDGDHSDLN